MKNLQSDKKEYTLISDDVDPNWKLKPVALFNLIQNLAGFSAESRGFGFSFMKLKGFLWVLTKMKARFYSYPEYNDKIALETWVRSIGKIITDRHFTGYVNGGNRFCSVITEWALLNIKTGKPELLNEHINAKDVTNYRAAGIEKPVKIAVPEKPFLADERIVRYSDIDLNGHMSNIKYPEFFLDAYEYSFLKNSYISDIEMNFLNECKYGQKLTIFRSEIENTHYGFIIREDDNKEVFRIKIIWI